MTRQTRLRGGCLVAGILLALTVATTAVASIPPYQDRRDAKRFARDWWATRAESPDCSGVRLRWNSWEYDPGIRRKLAYVPIAAQCTVVFNAKVNWARVPESNPGETTFLGDGWWRFCATVMHEWGHLRGMPHGFDSPPFHSRSRNNIMADTETLNTFAWWWPYFPGCRYEGDGVDYDE
jgi:hypothetical protein